MISPLGLSDAATAFADVGLLLAGVGVGVCSSVVPYVRDQQELGALALNLVRPARGAAADRGSDRPAAGVDLPRSRRRGAFGPGGHCTPTLADGAGAESRRPSSRDSRWHLVIREQRAPEKRRER